MSYVQHLTSYYRDLTVDRPLPVFPLELSVEDVPLWGLTFT